MQLNDDLRIANTDIAHFTFLLFWAPFHNWVGDGVDPVPNLVFSGTAKNRSKESISPGYLLLRVGGWSLVFFNFKCTIDAI